MDVILCVHIQLVPKGKGICTHSQPALHTSFLRKNDETGTAACNSRGQEFLTQVVLSHSPFQRKLWLMNNV